MTTPTAQQLRELILSQPAMKPPGNEVANFDHPPSIRSELLGFLTSLFLVATFAVGVRIIIGYLIYAAGYNAINYIMIFFNGVGSHQWNIRLRDLIPILHYMNMASILYGIIILAIKVAIILQCLHLLSPSGVRDTAYWVFHCLLWSHVLFYVIVTFVEIFRCNLRENSWDPTITTGHCMNSKAVYIAAAAINAGSDFMLVLIPQVIIWRLKMSTSRKWAVASVFLVGLLACAAATVRMYYSIILLHNADFTWTATLMGIWVEVEIACGFLVASMPFFPRFFRHQTLFSSMGSGLRFFLRRDRTRTSAKYSGERLGSMEASGSNKNGNVTDVEFEELVRRTDLSMVTVDGPGQKS